MGFSAGPSHTSQPTPRPIRIKPTNRHDAEIARSRPLGRSAGGARSEARPPPARAPAKITYSEASQTPRLPAKPRSNEKAAMADAAAQKNGRGKDARSPRRSTIRPPARKATSGRIRMGMRPVQLNEATPSRGTSEATKIATATRMTPRRAPTHARGPGTSRLQNARQRSRSDMSRLPDRTRRTDSMSPRAPRLHGSSDRGAPDRLKGYGRRP